MTHKEQVQCMYEYRKFAKKDDCGIEIITDVLFISHEKSKDEYKTYFLPENETVENFLDRIERSKKADKNLFYEEWEEDTTDYTDIEI